MGNVYQNSTTASDVEMDALKQEVQLLQKKQEIEFSMSPQGRELAVINAKKDAEFALSPVGQELQRFQTTQRMGQMFASSSIVPDTYKGNVANCAIACDIAIRMNANPLMVMQNLYLVHGNPSWSSKFLIATINTCGRFQPIRYECNELKGDAYGWRCFTYEIGDKKKTERLDGPWVTRAMVKAEGWDKKSGSKWLSMPEQMFRYRAAAFWQRLYAPEISMGFNTVEESHDVAEDVEFIELDHQGNPHQPQDEALPRSSKKTLAERARERAMQAATVVGNIQSGMASTAIANPETGEVVENRCIDWASMPAEKIDAMFDDVGNLDSEGYPQS